VAARMLEFGKPVASGPGRCPLGGGVPSWEAMSSLSPLTSEPNPELQELELHAFVGKERRFSFVAPEFSCPAQ
jgi:hypothetical protein